MLGGGDSPFRGMVVAALAFLVWDILITTDEEVILLPGLIPVALETDLVSWKRSNSYGRTSLFLPLSGYRVN